MLSGSIISEVKICPLLLNSVGEEQGAGDTDGHILHSSNDGTSKDSKSRDATENEKSKIVVRAKAEKARINDLVQELRSETGEKYETAKSNYGFVDNSEFKTTADLLIKDAGKIDAKLSEIIKNPSSIKVIDTNDVGFEGTYNIITVEISMTTTYLNGSSVSGLIHEISHSFCVEHPNGGYHFNKKEISIRANNARYRPFYTDTQALDSQRLDRAALYKNVYTLDFVLQNKRL
ncbi:MULTISPECIES: hypothetical protein [unclassified Pseudoalteromonas]|uniref:hypothetical protein n=1 Tax=unclassified Pseudoalteromonas TaxID=194690 RepID=UPI000975EF45|nr:MULTISPECIES: hypothetical protein [unclassified Pseudoalteromonas]MDN3490492.1 hypothetical protein [Pseudoalteromonas sp. APC 3694]